jgi:hypothetical protein
MCWCTAERVASASAGAKAVAWNATRALLLELCMMGCSCRLGMILANLVLGSKWWMEGEHVAIVARHNSLVLLTRHF